MRVGAAIEQAWPAFVLVTGLLLVGVVAHSDGLFAQAGRLLERVPGPPAVLLLCGMAAVVIVTAILNLDTAVVFLTPVLVLAARQRGIDEEGFLFSAVFMANASSLYLPGSNLTNLLVLGRHHVSGGAFAAQMVGPAFVASIVTAVGLLAVFGRRLGAAGERPEPEALGRPSGLGLVAALAAAALTLALTKPAIAVFAVGVVAVAVQLARGKLDPRAIKRAIGPVVLGGLFALSVGVGVIARSWGGPGTLVAHTGVWATAGIGAAASVLINNLPAAVLLSARGLGHPYALLVGLNLGPNLAVSGSLSAYLWFRAARQLELRPSLVAFSRRGLLLAPGAAAAALAVLIARG
jgi:arsenical pump membrane protein